MICMLPRLAPPTAIAIAPAKASAAKCPTGAGTSPRIIFIASNNDRAANAGTATTSAPREEPTQHHVRTRSGDVMTPLEYIALGFIDVRKSGKAVLRCAMGPDHASWDRAALPKTANDG